MEGTESVLLRKSRDLTDSESRTILKVAFEPRIQLVFILMLTLCLPHRAFCDTWRQNRFSNVRGTKLQSRSIYLYSIQESTHENSMTLNIVYGLHVRTNIIYDYRLFAFLCTRQLVLHSSSICEAEKDCM